MVFTQKNRNSSNEKTTVFVFGCQRSGTTMLIKSFQRSRDCSVYGEADPRANKDWRFREESVIRKMIAEDPCSYIVFKPLNDIQYADQYIDKYQNVKAIWIYRNYNDVVNSAVAKWKDAQKNIIQWISSNYGEPAIPEDKMSRDCSVYLEIMNTDTWSSIKDQISDVMSNSDGAALLWYIRNCIYFDLNLQNNEKIILVKYEDLVSAPKEKIKDIFDFIGCKFSNRYVREINSASIRKQKPPLLNKKIETICEDLQKKLDNQNLKIFEK